jgi:hypothetical protein
MPNTKHCPKCQTGMEKGFTPDFTYGTVMLGSWVEGELEKSWAGNLKTKGKRKIGITVYRCAGCGFLETYALEP